MIPKQIQLLDYIVPVTRKKRVTVDGESVHGAFSEKHGIELEKGPAEALTQLHEVGHLVFLVSRLSKDWEKRFGSELAGELEEEVIDRILPLYLQVYEEYNLSRWMDSC